MDYITRPYSQLCKMGFDALLCHGLTVQLNSEESSLRLSLPIWQMGMLKPIRVKWRAGKHGAHMH